MTQTECLVQTGTQSALNKRERRRGPCVPLIKEQEAFLYRAGGRWKCGRQEHVTHVLAN